MMQSSARPLSITMSSITANVRERTESTSDSEEDLDNGQSILIGFLMQYANLSEDVVELYRKQAKFVVPSAEIYEHITTYVNNSQDHNFGIRINRIIRVKRRNRPFLKACKKIPGARMMLWHGTVVNSFNSILQEGLKKPTFQLGDTRLQGQGIYFADRASKSAQYCVSNQTCGGQSPVVVGSDGLLLLCDVLLGKMYSAEEPDHGRETPPEGYHSVEVKGEKVPDPLGCKILNKKVILPYGVTVDYDSSDEDEEEDSERMVKFNEYIVYEEDRVNIRFLVHCTFTRNKYKN